MVRIAKSCSVILVVVSFLLTCSTVFGAYEYEDPDGRFIADVPDGWRTQTLNAGGRSKAAFYGKVSSIVVVAEDYSENAQITDTERDRVRENMVSSMRQKLGIEITDVSESDTTVDGASAWIYSFRVTKDDTLMTMALFIKSGCLYSVTISTKTDIDKIISAFLEKFECR